MEPKLFISIYSDEDVTPKLARELRKRDYEATSYLDVGMIDVDDDVHFAYAIEHGYAVMTCNRDGFEALAENAFWSGKHHYGVIIATHAIDLLRN
jgi:predicted nuclease of predicted toxin-antitoxin system